MKYPKKTANQPNRPDLPFVVELAKVALAAAERLTADELVAHAIAQKPFEASELERGILLGLILGFRRQRHTH